MAVQTCDQAITFRNFDYARALEVVQDEEYLDDSDFDEIRLSRKQGEVFQAIDKFKEKVDNNFEILSEDSDILGKFDNEYHREKRSFLEAVVLLLLLLLLLLLSGLGGLSGLLWKELLGGGRREVGRGEVFFVPIAIQPHQTYQGSWELF